MTLAATINGTEGRQKCHNRPKIACEFRQAAQIIKYHALWKSCSSLPFTRGSAAAGNVSVKVIPEDMKADRDRAAAWREQAQVSQKQLADQCEPG